MSVPESALRLMLELGLSAEQMVALADAFASDQKPRSAGAERTRRWRERKVEASHVTSQETSPRDVTGDVTAPPSPDKEKSPRPPKEINPTPERCAALHADVREPEPIENDWPEAEGEGKRITAGWARRLAELAGPGLADPAKHGSLLLSSAEIGRWHKAGCSWEEDIVPVVTARTLDRRTEPITSWTYFTQAVLAQASRRKASLTIPDQPEIPAHGRRAQPSRPDPRTSSRLERFEAYNDASLAALRSGSG